MSREWKSGDVALVTFDNATGNQRAQGINRIQTQIALVDADHVGIAEPADAWFVFGATSRIGATWESVREARPLVVIDPDDREAVERLQDLFADERDRNGGQSRLIVGGWADDMQAALREYANPKPPRPGEPQGLGAVVEDEDGVLWVRAGKELQTPDHWRATSGENLVGWWSTYDRITAVRVLSPGVVVDQ